MDIRCCRLTGVLLIVTRHWVVKLNLWSRFGEMGCGHLTHIGAAFIARDVDENLTILEDTQQVSGYYQAINVIDAVCGRLMLIVKEIRYCLTGVGGKQMKYS